MIVTIVRLLGIALFLFAAMIVALILGIFVYWLVSTRGDKRK